MPFDSLSNPACRHPPVRRPDPVRGYGQPEAGTMGAYILERLPAIRVCQCVGGSFDVVAGAVRRAPRAFRQLHLEWFYRLACQPTRWRRQMNLLRFAGEVLRRRLHIG